MSKQIVLTVITLVVWLAQTTRSGGVALPPLARVETTDYATTTTWQQSGELSGSVPFAGAEIRAAMGAAGWQICKSVILGQTPRHSELMVWRRGKKRVLFMVWEKEAGTCGFAWGEER